jgi:hypothetical protein
MLPTKLITEATNSTPTATGEALTSEVREEAEEEEECLSQHVKFATRPGTQQ